MNLRTELGNDLLKRNIDKGEFGLEKESLRISSEGFLSHTKHPFKEQRNITRDFCENQTELITDVFDNVQDVLSHLEQLQIQVIQTLQQLETGRELLWPFSNPPYVRGEADIPVAQFEGREKKKTEYRNYLAEKYGKRKMLFSGIHLNYSFADKMLREGYQVLLSTEGRGLPREELPTYQLYKNNLYLQLARKAVKYSWLIVYLTAASPVMDNSFLEGCADDEHEIWCEDAVPRYASVRCGELGYWNDFIPILDYRNLESYIQSIEAYVHSGRLRSASELYYPVRLKPKGENSLEHLRENGINHIELRMLDVNPLSQIGLMREDVEFLHYFLIYLINEEDIELTEEEQINAIKNEKCAAEFDDSNIFIRASDGSCKQIRQAALDILHNMEAFYVALEERGVLKTIQYQKDKLLIPNNRYADRIQREFGVGYVKKGISLADAYAKELLAKKYVNELPVKQSI